MGREQEFLNKKVLPAALRDFAARAMEKCGLSPEDATLSAEVFATTDAWGIHTHGTRQIRLLMKNVRDGRIDPRAVPQTVGEGPAWAILDGRLAMPTVVAFRGMELAIRKAKQAGIGPSRIAWTA